MSGLPVTIQVKRKRAENGVVDFICFEDYAHKRHKADDSKADEGYIYQRKKVDDVESAESLASAPTQSQPRVVPASAALKYLPPTIQATKAGEENRPIKPLRKKRASDLITAAPVVSTPTPPASALLSDEFRNARRFHLSKSNLLLSGSGVNGARITKKRSSAVFVERGGCKKARATDCYEPSMKQDVSTKQSQTSEATDKTPKVTFELPIREESPAKQKKPTARVPVQPVSQPALPPSFYNHGAELDMDQLARDMDAYSLEIVKQNLARVEQDKQKEQARATKAKFRPKGQATGQRFYERNPEYVAQWEREHSRRTQDIEIDELDEDDYIVETYERVPASALSHTVLPHQIGFLVFDNEEDRLEFFYGTEGDSDDEFLEDEDDENAEGHYTTDYPDEELEWDDELEHNAYSYLTANASDIEEFDEQTFLEQAFNQNAIEEKLSGHCGPPHLEDEDMSTW